jgi:hypothetical protein
MQVIMTLHENLQIGPELYEFYTHEDKKKENFIVLNLVQGFKITLYALSF